MWGKYRTTLLKQDIPLTSYRWERSHDHTQMSLGNETWCWLRFRFHWLVCCNLSHSQQLPNQSNNNNNNSNTTTTTTTQAIANTVCVISYFKITEWPVAKKIITTSCKVSRTITCRFRTWPIPICKAVPEWWASWVIPFIASVEGHTKECCYLIIDGDHAISGISQRSTIEDCSNYRQRVKPLSRYTHKSGVWWPHHTPPESLGTH